MDSYHVYVKYTKVLGDMQITKTRLIGGGRCMKNLTRKNKICTLTFAKTNMHLVLALGKIVFLQRFKLGELLSFSLFVHLAPPKMYQQYVNHGSQ
jgi:hypothetical protein